VAYKLYAEDNFTQENASNVQFFDVTTLLTKYICLFFRTFIYVVTVPVIIGSLKLPGLFVHVSMYFYFLCLAMLKGGTIRFTSNVCHSNLRVQMLLILKSKSMAS